MKDIGPRHVEEIVLAISSAEKRIIGLTSPEVDELVGSVAWRTAQFLARSGRSVLLIDFQQAIGLGEDSDWTASDILAGRRITHRRQGLDVITITPTPETRYALADPSQLRTTLEGFLDSYQFVLLELGPVMPGSPEKLNPLPMGAACDYLLLTCRRGATLRSRLQDVVAKLRAARCTIGGIILNETAYSSMGAEIASLAFWLLWPMPRLRRRVQDWAMKSDLLN